MTTMTVSHTRQVADALAQLACAVDAVTDAISDADGGDPALVEQLRSAHRAASRLQAAEAVLVSRVEGAGLWRGDGFTSLSRFLCELLGVLPATSRRLIDLGRALSKQLPAFEAPALAGDVGADHVRMTAKVALATQARIDALGIAAPVEVSAPSEWSVFNQTDPHQITHASTNTRDDGLDRAAGDGADELGAAARESAARGARDVGEGADGNRGMDTRWWMGLGLSPASSPTVTREPAAQPVTTILRGEEQLALAASLMRAADYRLVLAKWAVRVDPQGLEDTYREAEEREYFVLARTLGGWHAEGFLTDKTGQLLKTALDHVHRPPVAGDPRSAGQRRAADLGHLADLVLSHQLAGEPARARPHIAVTVSFETLRRLAAQAGVAGQVEALVGTSPAEWEDGSGPIPHTLLAQLICDGEVARYVFGPSNELLNYGHTLRLFTRDQRRALRATQTVCAYPGCSTDAAWGEAHHATPFGEGGPTDHANGAILCSHHHRVFHLHHLTMRCDKTGRWRFLRPDGTPISTPGG